MLLVPKALMHLHLLQRNVLHVKLAILLLNWPHLAAHLVPSALFSLGAVLLNASNVVRSLLLMR